ncbi:MAG: hypothetical protein WBB45_04980 [Cyclobacteriaceae bacterium]
MKKDKLSLGSISISSFATTRLNLKEETQHLKGGESLDERFGCTFRCETDPYCTIAECFTQPSPYGECSELWLC